MHFKPTDHRSGRWEWRLPMISFWTQQLQLNPRADHRAKTEPCPAEIRLHSAHGSLCRACGDGHFGGSRKTDRRVLPGLRYHLLGSWMVSATGNSRYQGCKMIPMDGGGQVGKDGQCVVDACVGGNLGKPLHRQLCDAFEPRPTWAFSAVTKSEPK